MRIARVRLLNWMRFAGENEVDLEGSVYGIVGVYDDDARRSNWSGKTSFVEAIRFALFGEHRAAREDGWIAHGEDGGGVTVTLTDGTMITRTRRRGQATKLMVERGEERATGDAAQGVIDRVIGISRDDFEVTCWFGQKQMARLILAKPVERFDLVSGWFGLDPLRRCEDRVRQHLTERVALLATTEREQYATRSRLIALESEWTDALGEGRRGQSFGDQIAEMIVLREERVRDAQGRVNSALVGVEEFAVVNRAVEAAEELSEVRERGARLNAEIGALDAGEKVAEWTEKLSAAKASSAAAASELRAKRTLARGEFSGRCPVDASACPAAVEINARVKQNGKLYDDAMLAYDAAVQAEAATRLELDSIAASARKRDMLMGQRDALRDRAKVLAHLAKGAPRDFDAGEHARRLADLDAAHRALADAERGLGALQGALREWGALVAQMGAAEATLAGLRAGEAVGRAALRIFGRQGAQKRIAEVALEEIERGANAILRDAAIDLSLRVQWGREGVGLATWCGECGAPFSSSARVKVCERCKAERGPKVVERLDIELSDRSGAAEDLAGAALQLAASAWLRRERGVSWAVAFLDEPFGALDEANRRGFASHLVTMLTGAAGIEQAFIVAHHPDVIDGLPGRIVVRAGAEASTVEVR